MGIYKEQKYLYITGGYAPQRMINYVQNLLLMDGLNSKLSMCK